MRLICKHCGRDDHLTREHEQGYSVIDRPTPESDQGDNCGFCGSPNHDSSDHLGGGRCGTCGEEKFVLDQKGLCEDCGPTCGHCGLIGCYGGCPESKPCGYCGKWHRKGSKCPNGNRPATISENQTNPAKTDSEPEYDTCDKCGLCLDSTGSCYTCQTYPLRRYCYLPFLVLLMPFLRGADVAYAIIEATVIWLPIALFASSFIAEYSPNKSNREIRIIKSTETNSTNKSAICPNPKCPFELMAAGVPVTGNCPAPNCPYRNHHNQPANGLSPNNSDWNWRGIQAILLSAALILAVAVVAVGLLITH